MRWRPTLPPGPSASIWRSATRSSTCCPTSRPMPARVWPRAAARPASTTAVTGCHTESPAVAGVARSSSASTTKRAGPGPLAGRLRGLPSPLSGFEVARLKRFGFDGFLPAGQRTAVLFRRLTDALDYAAEHKLLFRPDGRPGTAQQQPAADLRRPAPQPASAASARRSPAPPALPTMVAGVDASRRAAAPTTARSSTGCASLDLADAGPTAAERQPSVGTRRRIRDTC